MMCGNTMAERLGMWSLSTLGRIFNDPGLYGSPTLAFLGLRPTLRWVWSGDSDHAAKRKGGTS
jgi:hypothetical protein